MTIKMYGQWEYYPGNELYSLAMPDYYSTYLSYTIDFTCHPNTGLQITGAFPQARYMSFNVYATSAGTSLGALTDFQITTPDDSADNPFIAGNNAAPGGQYVVKVEPIQADSPTDPNTLYFDPQQLTNGKLTVVIRYYVPQPDNFGGMNPPEVAVYHIADGRPVTPTPAGVETDMDANVKTFAERLAPIFLTARGEQLRFFHAGGGGQFNNADNIYLIAAVKDVDFSKDCVVIRVKAPAFPQSNQQLDQVPVRYWSFNQGNPNTSTPIGMADHQFQPAWDGYVYIVMGNESLKAAAEKNGYNYMPWLVHDPRKGVVLYRNMLTIPQYRGSIARVPQMPNPPWKPGQLDQYEASLFIGEYAPSGKIVSNKMFIESARSVFQ